MNLNKLPAAFLLTLSLAVTPTAAQELREYEHSTAMQHLAGDDAVLQARALCAIGDRSDWARDAKPELLDLLDNRTAVRFDVCDGVGDRHSMQRNGCARDPNGCPDRTIGELAAAVLTESGRSVREPLEQYLQHTSEHARANASWALGAIGSSSSVGPLSHLVNDEYESVRENVAWALGAIGAAEAVPPLTVLMRDEAVGVRENSAWALGAVGSENGINPLIEALEDTESAVLESAIWAMGAIGDRRAVEHLLPLLSSERSDIREQTAWALGAIGDEAAIDALLELMEDSDVEVRRMAIWAINAVS